MAGLSTILYPYGARGWLQDEAGRVSGHDALLLGFVPAASADEEVGQRHSKWCQVASGADSQGFAYEIKVVSSRLRTLAISWLGSGPQVTPLLSTKSPCKETCGLVLSCSSLLCLHC